MFGVRELQLESIRIRIEILGSPILTQPSFCASSIEKIVKVIILNNTSNMWNKF